MPTTAPTVTEIDEFAIDIERGLTQSPKSLPSKYFYDEKGDIFFQEIMRMPEYYPTNCEYEIFFRQADEILTALGSLPFDLIELGAGDGMKTKVLLAHFLEKGVDFCYRPIDISGSVLAQLVGDCADSWPGLTVNSVEGDYFTALQKIAEEDTGRKKVILFLGGNIGNFQWSAACQFLQQLQAILSRGDQLLIGFDLKKDPAIILEAYNDRAGITAAFNLNLLERINREYNADFKLDQFQHWPTYEPVSGEARSFLVSTCAQSVQIEQLQLQVHFAAWEAIHVETSAKYSLVDIQALAKATRFEWECDFLDERSYFADSLWRVS